jgi:hypothetical protein
VAEHLPRRTLEQQPPKAILSKPAPRPQETGTKQSFRGQLAFNPLRAPAAPKADSDSDEEQWQRIKAGNVRAAAMRRLSAAAPAAANTAPMPASAQGRRMSLSNRPALNGTAKAANVHESDSDDEQWQRVKKMVADKPKAAAIPGGRASISGRLSISRAPVIAASNQAAPKAQSDSDDEHWAMLRASRTAASRKTVGTNAGQQRGAGQAELSDSDEEQWRRVKAQVTARTPPASGDDGLLCHHKFDIARRLWFFSSKCDCQGRFAFTELHVCFLPAWMPL